MNNLYYITVKSLHLLSLVDVETSSRLDRRRFAAMSRRGVLHKQHSWSPDAERDEAWHRRKALYGRGIRRSQSFTHDDIEELKGCIDLGFGFEPDSPELDPKLSETLPALQFYCAVHRQYNGGMSRSSSATSMDSLTDAGSSSTASIIDQGDDPEMVKTRLRQWAQVVACSLRQNSGGPN